MFSDFRTSDLQLVFSQPAEVYFKEKLHLKCKHKNTPDKIWTAKGKYILNNAVECV